MEQDSLFVWLMTLVFDAWNEQEKREAEQQEREAKQQRR